MMLRSISFILFLIPFKIYSINSNEYIEHFLDNSNSLVQVDFFIIQNLTIENRDLEEKWKKLEKFKFSNELIEIKNEPTTLIDLPSSVVINENFLPKINISSIDNESDDQNKILPNKEIQPFLFEKIPFLNEIKEIEDNLNRSKDYRVIYYNSWFQPVLEKDKTIPVYIDSIKKDKKVYGEIKIYKERFVHIDSNIRFAEKTTEQELISYPPNLKMFQDLLELNQKSNEKEVINENYWIATIFNTVKLNIQNIGEFIYPESQDISLGYKIAKVPQYKYRDLYEINRKTKLEKEKFNFIDHPHFSILIKVTENSN